jgi:hypothetical protein
VVVAAPVVVAGAVVVPAGAWAFLEPQAASNKQATSSVEMRIMMAAP